MEKKRWINIEDLPSKTRELVKLALDTDQIDIASHLIGEYLRGCEDNEDNKNKQRKVL